MLASIALGICAEDAGAAALSLHTFENLKKSKAQVVVTYGTSLTAGGAWVAELSSALKEHFGEKAKLINHGMSGCNSGDGVAKLDAVLKDKPDLILIEFGMNDAVLRFNISVEQARKNLETIIEKLKASNPSIEIVLMTMNPPTGAEREGKRPEIEKYYQMYRDTAGKLKLPLIDLFANWQKLLSGDPKTFQKYVPDGLHPNKEGSLAVTWPALKQALGL